ncbi:hypothetical protein BJY04DRAFT_195298 [Aspergillus karnatakaensis]|uniref:uncharacterized protein n=1 Tax=Aspergillus karnatakaensis TaxID=1810916 RepID=UPI003CCCB91A
MVIHCSGSRSRSRFKSHSLHGKAKSQGACIALTLPIIGTVSGARSSLPAGSELVSACIQREAKGIASKIRTL